MSIRSVVLTVCIARAPVIAHTFGLVRFDFREVTSCHDYNEHEEDENDHNVEAELTAHLNLRRDAATVGALFALAFRCALALVKVFLHAVLADLCTARAITKRATGFKTAVQVHCASLHTLNDRRANIAKAAPGQTLEAVITMIVRLLLAFVANGSGHAASLAAAESRAITGRII